MNALVSIIVPVYNVEKYLDECIESLINQTYKNIEIILVDDGSTDSSGILCDEWKKRDTRIVVIHQKNCGLSAARNIGIHFSKGKIISFIDSDDWIERIFIEWLITLYTKYNADIVCCRKEVSHEYYYKNAKIKHDVEKIYTNKKAFEYSMYDTISACNKIFSKKLFDKIIFPEGDIHEDVATVPILMINSTKVVVLEECLYHHRVNFNSITRSSFYSKRFDIIKAIDRVENYIKKYHGNLKLDNVLFFRRISAYVELMDSMILSDVNRTSDLYKNTENIILKNKNYILNEKHFTLKRKLGVIIFIHSILLYKKILELKR